MAIGNSTDIHAGSERDDEQVVVSVVIPTVGRPELARAISSARAQDLDVRVEIIVVFDGTDHDQLDASAIAMADVVIRTRGREGGSRARNLGIEAASGQYVALLDDDDEWLPQKLRHQLTILDADPAPHQTLVAGRHIHVDARTGVASAPGPSRLISDEQAVEDYLFRRRKPSGDRASMYTSTLLVARELALAVPWDTTLKRHQDWDWVIRLQTQTGAKVIQSPEPLVKIQTGSAQSISASSNWKSSLEWAERSLPDRAVRVDFLAAQTLRYALQARDRTGVSATLTAIWETRRAPSFGPIVIGFGGLLSRRTIERITARTIGSRKSGWSVSA